MVSQHQIIFKQNLRSSMKLQLKWKQKLSAIHFVLTSAMNEKKKKGKMRMAIKEVFHWIKTFAKERRERKTSSADLAKRENLKSVINI